MEGQQQLDAPMEVLLEGQILKGLWDNAAEYFSKICGNSLQNGEIESLNDVAKIIGSMSPAISDNNKIEEQKWKKMKSVGLISLRCLKILLKVASDAGSLVPIPEAAAKLTFSALSFVFSIPEAIIVYRDAINKVFGDISSALIQFRIYASIKNINLFLVQQIHSVLISVVKVCAHVVKYRQGRWQDRVKQHVKSIFEADSQLAERMGDFKQALQQQHEIEGTVTLAAVVNTQENIALLRSQSSDINKTTRETLVVAQETHKGVQALEDDADRLKTLIKIRDTLGVESTVRLDSNTTQTCTDIASKCLRGTGSWIWNHKAYVAWTAPKEDEKETSRLLLVYGPPSSGKTLVSAHIIKSLEEKRGRTYVAHYFFPSKITKFDNEKDLIQMALKYMAFQIARVDVTMQKLLGKACDEEHHTIRHPMDINDLWNKLKIGVSGLNTLYYLVFDGIENLPSQQANLLLNFISGIQSTGESGDRVRILVSGTEDQFTESSVMKSAMNIKISDHNASDMRIIIEETLSR